MITRFAAALAVAMAGRSAMAQSSRPDSRVTPGAVNPAVTPFTIARTICSPGWAHTVRPPSNYTSRLKKRQLRALAWPDQRMRDYEEDHLIPLELGGAPADRRNLWPQPRQPTDGWTAEDKDRLEGVLRRAVCVGALALGDAQRAIANDWTAAYGRFIDRNEGDR